MDDQVHMIYKLRFLTGWLRHGSRYFEGFILR